QPRMVLEMSPLTLQAFQNTSKRTRVGLALKLNTPLLQPLKEQLDGNMLCLLMDNYSTQLHSTMRGSMEVISRGSFFQVPEMLQSTLDALKLQLNLGNCLALLAFAKKHRIADLKSSAYRLMSNNYLQILREASIYGQLNATEREFILQTRMEGKRLLVAADLESIYKLRRPQWSLSCPAVNEISPRFLPPGALGDAYVYIYSDMEDSWLPLTKIPKEANLKGCAVCSMFNYLFLAGGIKGSTQGGQCSNRVFCYNPMTNIWTEVAPMKQSRSQFKMVAVDGFLYAIGGECLYSVERYDPRLGKWTFRTSLPKGTFAVAHEATTCNGEIYISGGHLFHRLLRYDPCGDLWEECPNSSSRQRSTALVGVRNFLYRFDINRDSGVSVFKYHTLAKVWRECAAVHTRKPSPFQCTVADNTIYCVSKQKTMKFAADGEIPKFEAEELCAFSVGKGTPHPLILSLPE
uniref:Kelch repeat and BTB domain containing 11 n=1 Tax=Latimeria chalumnae TaxID=7897 RepID=H3AAT7_LATCH